MGNFLQLAVTFVSSLEMISLRLFKNTAGCYFSQAWLLRNDWRSDTQQQHACSHTYIFICIYIYIYILIRLQQRTDRVRRVLSAFSLCAYARSMQQAGPTSSSPSSSSSSSSFHSFPLSFFPLTSVLLSHHGRLSLSLFCFTLAAAM